MDISRRHNTREESHLLDTADAALPSKQSTPALAQFEHAGTAPSQRTFRRRQRTQAEGRRLCRVGAVGVRVLEVVFAEGRTSSVGYDSRLRCSILAYLATIQYRGLEAEEKTGSERVYRCQRRQQVDRGARKDSLVVNLGWQPSRGALQNMYLVSASVRSPF